MEDECVVPGRVLKYKGILICKGYDYGGKAYLSKGMRIQREKCG